MTKKPMILGIGGSGAVMVEQLSLLPGIDRYHLALIDTDRTTIEHSPANIRLIAAADWGVANGSGCGGDVIRGERALASERTSVEKMLAEASFLTVCGGLGGGKGGKTDAWRGEKERKWKEMPTIAKNFT
ncbi:MAG: hypothetical protein J6Q65_01520 [Lentisphaeria bacterium]|nr:hypothetical protein [Lentisphaeria bacterium]